MATKYTFVCNDDFARSKVTIEVETYSLTELIAMFEDFLRASRFHFDGHLDIVEESTKMPSDSHDVDVFGHMVNQHLQGINGTSENCEICGIAKDVMKTQRCWDEKCPKKDEHANQG